jgi:hypothetical protein
MAATGEILMAAVRRDDVRQHQRASDLRHGSQLIPAIRRRGARGHGIGLRLRATPAARDALETLGSTRREERVDWVAARPDDRFSVPRPSPDDRFATNSRRGQRGAHAACSDDPSVRTGLPVAERKAAAAGCGSTECICSLTCMDLIHLTAGELVSLGCSGNGPRSWAWR